jgi:hypothetical protein
MILNCSALYLGKHCSNSGFQTHIFRCERGSGVSVGLYFPSGLVHRRLTRTRREHSVLQIEKKEHTERISPSEYLARTSNEISIMSGCEVCGALAATQCSKCRTTFYCCKEHQLQDWKNGHKLICQDSKHFPKEVRNRSVTPSSSQCYLSISGKISDDKGNEVKDLKQRVPISAQQLLRFTESPSHLASFLDQLTSPKSPYMQDLHKLATANNLKCSDVQCCKPAIGVLLTSACFLTFPPTGNANIFPLVIVSNGTWCSIECLGKVLLQCSNDTKEKSRQINMLQKAIVKEIKKKRKGNDKRK